MKPPVDWTPEQADLVAAFERVRPLLRGLPLGKDRTWALRHLANAKCAALKATRKQNQGGRE